MAGVSGDHRTPTGRRPRRRAGSTSPTPDSRVVKGLRGFLQGDNAQAVTNEHQVVLAAEIETVGADFGHLEPMLDAAQRELAAADIDELPEVLLADAGSWHGEQMQRIVDRGIQSLSRPTPAAVDRRGATGAAAATTRCAKCWPAIAAASSTASANR